MWFGGEAHDKLNPAQQNKPLNKYPPPPTLLCGAGQSWGQGCQPWSIAPAGVGAAGQCRSKPSPWPPLVGAQPQPPSAPPLLRGWEGGCLGLDPSPHSQQCAGSQPPRVLPDAATALSCPLLSPCPPNTVSRFHPPTCLGTASCLAQAAPPHRVPHSTSPTGPRVWRFAPLPGAGGRGSCVPIEHGGGGGAVPQVEGDRGVLAGGQAASSCGCFK